MNIKRCFKVLLVSMLMMNLIGCRSSRNKDTITITNVSYDPTREFYEAYNKDFIAYYKKKTGKRVEVVQSHGGSGSQARSVVEGADADVVTLALEHDITLIQNTGLIKKNWIKSFPKDSSPYTSTIVFLVRKGNKKHIKDWDDLIKKNIDVITPDPKSSGGACWNFLAAWSYALNKTGTESDAKEFVKKLYANVSVMDSGARASTTTFVENGQGDVLIAWENEALNTIRTYKDKFELITPSRSILAQPSVSIVDENVDIDGTRKVSHDYLSYLYSKKSQKLIGQYGYRPTNKTILKQFKDKFDLNVELSTIKEFGGWNNAYKKFFSEDAIFDQIKES